MLCSFRVLREAAQGYPRIQSCEGQPEGVAGCRSRTNQEGVSGTGVLTNFQAVAVSGSGSVPAGVSSFAAWEYYLPLSEHGGKRQLLRRQHPGIPVH